MKHKLLFLIIFISAFLNESNAQKDTAKIYSGSVVFNGLLQTGNTNKFIVQGRGEVKRAVKKLETIISFAASYGENKGVKDDNSYLGTFTADLFYQDMLSPFILEHVEYNFGKGISFGSQSGAGLKYLFIKQKRHHSSVSLALIYDYLNLFNAPPDFRENELRLSFRFKTKQELIKKKMTAGLMIMYQPAADMISDYNLYIDGTLEFPLNKHFKLNANYLYGFSNTVSVGRRRADNRLTFGAGLYF